MSLVRFPIVVDTVACDYRARRRELANYARLAEIVPPDGRENE